MPMWCVAPLKMNEGNLLGGKGTIGLQAAVPKRPHTRPLTFLHSPRKLKYFKDLDVDLEKRSCKLYFPSFVYIPMAVLSVAETCSYLCV